MLFAVTAQHPSGAIGHMGITQKPAQQRHIAEGAPKELFCNFDVSFQQGEVNKIKPQKKET